MRAHYCLTHTPAHDVMTGLLDVLRLNCIAVECDRTAIYKISACAEMSDTAARSLNVRVSILTVQADDP
jgi:hypothetical protein